MTVSDLSENMLPGKDNKVAHTFYINASLTCLKTRAYAQKAYNYLILNGLIFIKDFREADFIIIDTCAYCQAKQDDSIKAIKHFTKRRKNGSTIIIIGCLPKIDSASILKLGDFYIISSDELEKLDDLIKAKFKFCSIPVPIKVEDHLLNFSLGNFFIKRLLTELKLIHIISIKFFFKRCLKFIAKNIFREKNAGEYVDSSLTGYHVNVGRGCLGNCSYCAIKFVWGRMQSRPLADVLKDFEACIKINDKTKVISLETQDLGSYGLDINSTVVQLLNELFKIKGSYKIAVKHFNVNWIIKYYSDLEATFVKNADKIHYINVPIQSGSDRILELMRRPYRIEDARKTIINLKKKLPNIWVWADIMVGFPNETNEDFENTKQFIKEIVSYGVGIWLTPYSDRPNTEASKMKNKINKATINNRILVCCSLLKDQAL